MMLEFAPVGYGTIGLARNGPVAVLRLQRAQRLNAYTPEMGEDLVRAFELTAKDADLAAVVVTGEGRAFCAGADKDCFTGPPGPSGLALGAEAFVRGYARQIRSHPKLTIAAFNGVAVGIGVTMTLPMDIRLASAGAALKLNFAELGIMPGFGATYFLPHLVGLGQAKKLLLCEHRVDAFRALELGLVDEVLDDAGLLERAVSLGHAAAQIKPQVRSGIKEALNAGAEAAFEAALGLEASSSLRRGARQ